MGHVMDAEFRAKWDRLAGHTVCGREIHSKEEIDKHAVEAAYPLRFHLRELSHYIWYELLKGGRGEGDIFDALSIVKNQLDEYLSRYDVPPYEDSSVRHCKIGDLVDERRELRQTEVAPRSRTVCRVC